MRKKLTDYLLQMMSDYQSYKWVIDAEDIWYLEEEMTCSAPQGSRIWKFM